MQESKAKTFFERVLDTLVYNLPKLNNSELKLMLLINHLTVGSNLNSIPLSLDDLGFITGLSRKTLIIGISRLKSLSLIEVDKTDKPFRYSINRTEILKISLIESEEENFCKSVRNSRVVVEEVNRKRLGITPGEGDLFQLWNKYMSFYLNPVNELHKKCVQTYINTVSEEKALKAVKGFINNGNVDNSYIEEDLKELFGVE